MYEDRTQNYDPEGPEIHKVSLYLIHTAFPLCHITYSHACADYSIAINTIN